MSVIHVALVKYRVLPFLECQAYFSWSVAMMISFFLWVLLGNRNRYSGVFGGSLLDFDYPPIP